MHAKHSYKFVESSHPYARVQAALARVFSVPPERVKHMQGRIKVLMLKGLPESKPGKGARVLYGSDAILQWLFALMFEDASVTPAGAVKAVKHLWQRDFDPVDRWLEMALDAKSERNPVYLTLRPFFVKVAWDEHAAPEWIGFCRRWDEREMKRKWSDRAEEMNFRDNLRSFRESAEDEGAWFCARNLTRDLKLLRDCLEPLSADETDSKPDAKKTKAKP